MRKTSGKACGLSFPKSKTETSGRPTDMTTQGRGTPTPCPTTVGTADPDDDGPPAPPSLNLATYGSDWGPDALLSRVVAVSCVLTLCDKIRGGGCGGLIICDKVRGGGAGVSQLTSPGGRQDCAAGIPPASCFPTLPALAAWGRVVGAAFIPFALCFPTLSGFWPLSGKLSR